MKQPCTKEQSCTEKHLLTCSNYRQTHILLPALLRRDTSETDDAWTEERLKALEEDRVAVERMWGEHAQETDIGVLKFKIVSCAGGLALKGGATGAAAGLSCAILRCMGGRIYAGGGHVMLCHWQGCLGWVCVGFSIQGSLCTCGNLHDAQESNIGAHRCNTVGDAVGRFPASLHW